MRCLLAVLVLLSGCDLYWNSNGDDVCNGGGWADDVAPANELRNPDTGECQYVGGGGYGCDDPCGPCPAYDTDGAPGGAIAPNPDWGSCYSQCSQLDEATCIAASGCLASYNDVPGGAVFNGCFQTAPSGPLHTGTCIGLDAHACSQHDNCSIYYDGGSPREDLRIPTYERCAPEPSANGCSDVDCGPGSHCENQCAANDAQCNAMCVPDGDVCANVDCGAGYQCVETCVTPTPTHVGQCYGTCQAITACAALPDEAACSARNDCTGVYNGEDCTCYPDTGCTCQVLTYDHCESRNPAPL